MLTKFCRKAKSSSTENVDVLGTSVVNLGAIVRPRFCVDIVFLEVVVTTLPFIGVKVVDIPISSVAELTACD